MIQHDKCEAFEARIRELEKREKIDAEIIQILSRKKYELELKLETCRNALKIIKHTECDTYRIAADALAATRETNQSMIQPRP